MKKNINKNKDYKELNSINLKPSEKLELWHQRFCHFIIDILKINYQKSKFQLNVPFVPILNLEISLTNYQLTSPKEYLNYYIWI